MKVIIMINFEYCEKVGMIEDIISLYESYETFKTHYPGNLFYRSYCFSRV